MKRMAEALMFVGALLMGGHQLDSQGPGGVANAQTPAPIAKDALQMCYGKYALCDAAACTPIPRQKVPGGLPEKPSHALCECFVDYGQNLGPGDCENRQPRTVDGQVSNNGRYIMSTYSFSLYGSHPLMTCPAGGDRTVCFGYTCIVNELDPSKAHCTCPIHYGSPKFMTQGGQCDTGSCATTLWQGATPAEYQVINKIFAEAAGLDTVPDNVCQANE